MTKSVDSDQYSTITSQIGPHDSTFHDLTKIFRVLRVILLMEDIPAPVEVGSLSPLFTGFYTSQVVHEFFQHHFFKDLDKRNRFLGICFFFKFDTFSYVYGFCVWRPLFFSQDICSIDLVCFFSFGRQDDLNEAANEAQTNNSN